jgi:phosphoglycerate dehydrogenase-like enzyme
MKTPKPDIVFIAGTTDAWRRPVERLIDNRLEMMTLDPTESIPEGLNVSSVRIMVSSPQDAKAFAPLFPNLRWIQSTWAGVDALRESIPVGVAVTPLKGVFGQAMSEFVLGWILSIERQIMQRAKAMTWDSRPETGVRDKVMGILGTGSIGSAIAAAAEPLGIRCRGMNSTGESRPGFEQCFKSGDKHFFRGLDYAVSVLPKTPETDHILGASALSVMNKDGVVINVGRGNAVDEDALLTALNNHLIKAAVLDVFDVEPLPEGHPFWQHPRVFVTSHTAAPTAVDLVAIAMKTNLDRYLAGDTLQGIYSEAKGY